MSSLSGLAHDLRRYSLLGLPALLSLISIPIITRIFSPEEFGQYTLAVGIVFLVYAALGSGIGTGAIRFYAGAQPHEQQRVLSTTWTLTFGLMVLILLIGGGVLAIVYPMLSSTWKLLALFTLFFTVSFTLCTIGIELLRARRKVNTVTGLTLFQAFGGFVLSISIALMFRDVSGLIFGRLVAVSIVGAISLYALKNWSFRYSSLTLARQILIFGLPLALTNFAGWALQLSDRYLLKYFCGEGDVGIYALGYEISQRPVLLLGTIISTTAYPIAVQTWENQGKESTAAFISGILRIVMLLLLPAVCGLSMLAKPIVQIFAPESYAGASSVVPIVALGTLTYCFALINFPLLLEKKTIFIAVLYITAGVLQIALNVLLIPIFGYFAAAWTTLGSYAILLTLLWRKSHRLLPWKYPLKSWLKIAAACGGMLAILYVVLRLMQDCSPVVIVIVCVPVGACVYFGLTITTGEIGLDSFGIKKWKEWKKT